jgi:hypothetical protein
MKKIGIVMVVTILAMSASACFPGPTDPAPLPAARSR